MKLAEALNLRADCQKRVEKLRQRLVNSARVQEGDEPPEDPAQLIAELERVASEIESLVKRINRTNSLTPFQNGTTLSDALATRDSLMAKRSVYASLAEAAAVRQDRYSRSEVKYLSTVNIAEIQRTIDGLSQQYRLLDSGIQAANWSIDLLD
ncbi:MAG: DIP1984 family protein [Tildeniella torsiva UHER 1998/13D]|nr:DIP1984 family protein [Tildeniella torsiva UHER 1998/13D]